MEIWKDIPCYEGLYEVSNCGNVRSITRTVRFGRGYKTYESQFLKFQTDKDGYFRVGLSKNGKKKQFRVNRLVAMAFIDNPNNLPVVNHKDGDKQNNHVENLEWVTHSENDLHAFKTGLRKPSDGGTKRAVLQLNKDTLEVINEFESLTEASNKTGISIQMISYSCNGKTKTGKGFVWRFK